MALEFFVKTKQALSLIKSSVLFKGFSFMKFWSDASYLDSR